MKQLQLIFLIILLSLTCYSQGYLKEFGQIGKEEIELKEYSLDKDAEAVVLFDIAKSYFVRTDNNYNIVFQRTTRIKILSESGIKWAEVEIPFYQEGGIYEKVYDIEAYTYNYENGQMKKTPLNVSNVYDEKIDNSWNIKKFAVPNVKIGSIIEYRYKINSQYKFNLRDWEFQWRIPVVYSEYEVRTIPFFEYKYILQGANKFDYQTSFVDKGLSRQFGPTEFHDLVYKFVMKDMPAFNDEEFITSINDYIIKIDFQLSKIHYPNGGTVEIVTTWEDMIKNLVKHNDFGKYVKKSEKLASKLIDINNPDLKTDTEKFEYVLEYVKANFNWNNDNGKYASKSPNKFVEEKHGNCADINLFTIGLLNAFGIEAFPVILSTRKHGKINSNYPFNHFFNYVIIYASVDGKTILSDATETLSLNDRIPSKCINDKGLIINKDKIEWIGLECLFTSKIMTDIKIEITNNELINTNFTKTATEYDALYYRNYYTDKPEIIKKKLESNGLSIIDSSIKVQNQLNIKESYILNYKQTSVPEIINEKLYLTPFFNEVISDNPLKQKERTFPVDMIYPKKRIFKTTINIPEEYQVEFLPREVNINNQLFELTYSAKDHGDKIIVSFDYNFKKAVYSPVEYSKIKYYYGEIVKKGNEKIVLSKKTESAI